MTPPAIDPAADGLDLLIDAHAIAARVRELGAQIGRDLDGLNPVLVTVLRGAWMFAADLSRVLPIPHLVDFLRVSSYTGHGSSGQITLTHNIQDDIRDQHVLVVEDIVDTGATLQAIKQLLAAAAPASLRVVALLEKPQARAHGPRPDYIGFEIPDRFVVGYGLDLDGHYRGLPYIATIASGIEAPESTARP